jgi:hypothetical protein
MRRAQLSGHPTFSHPALYFPEGTTPTLCFGVRLNGVSYPVKLLNSPEKELQLKPPPGLPPGRSRNFFRWTFKGTFIY